MRVVEIIVLSLGLLKIASTQVYAQEQGYYTSKDLSEVSLQATDLEESDLTAQAESDTATPNSDESLNVNGASDSEFIIAPEPLPPEQLNPLISVFIWNDLPLSHLTEWEIGAQLSIGEGISTNVDANGLIQLRRRLERSLTSDGLLRLSYSGAFLNFSSTLKERRISVATETESIVIGQRQQLTLTASCDFIPESVRNSNAGPDDQCTFSPGLATNNESLDSRSIENPTEFNITQQGNGALFDRVSPESLEQIMQPDFSRGVPTEAIGLDIFIPNSGISEQQSRKANREEEIDNVPVFSVGRVHQVVQANTEQAVLGRTIRGASFILEDENVGLNTAVQAAAQFAPTLQPSIEELGKERNVQLGINQNLILAANRVRVPARSYTAYHAGIGSVSNDFEIGDDIRQEHATFNSIWVGLSPVISRGFQVNNSLTIGPREVLLETSAEGGAEADIPVELEIVAPGFDPLPFDSTVLKNADLYTQIYLTLFETPLLLSTESILTEEIEFWPHVSFSGDIANLNSSLRYYSGVITGETIRGYGGIDFSSTNLENRLAWTIAGIAYTEPNPEYFSNINGSLEKGWQLGDSAVLFTNTSFLVDFDRPREVGSVFISPSAFWQLGGGISFRPATFSLSYFPAIFEEDDGIQETLTLRATFRLPEQLRISAFFTPIADTTSRSVFGLSVDKNLGDGYNSPSIFFSWTRNEFDLIDNVVDTQDRFIVGFRFGYPTNPLTPEARQAAEERERPAIQEEILPDSPVIPSR